jgi:ClpP class serine protease
MGIYADYINRIFNWPELEAERKQQLKRVSDIRKRPVLVYASAITKQADISITYDDRVPFQDQLSNIDGDEVDVILETPGGYAEVVEDLVNMLRNKFSRVGMIIPGYAKSAGTIMAMSGDEILMEPSSALGPIDAQMMMPNGKTFSAHTFLEGLKR